MVGDGINRSLCSYSFSCSLGWRETAAGAIGDDDFILPRQAIASGGEIGHVGVWAIARASGDSHVAAMAELIEVVFDTPKSPCFTHEIKAQFGSNDFIRATTPFNKRHTVEVDEHPFAH